MQVEDTTTWNGDDVHYDQYPVLSVLHMPSTGILHLNRVLSRTHCTELITSSAFLDCTDIN
jgi:hypothetical protein